MLHTQLDSEGLPSARVTVCAGHAWHNAGLLALTKGWYVDAPHATHDDAPLLGTLV